MTPKRPSYPSIRRRQINIIEGMGTKDLKFSDAAKRFGVTPQQLRHFVTTDPKKLRKSYNRNTANARLFESGQRAEVRKAVGVSRIRVYERREESRKYSNSYQIGKLLQAKRQPDTTALEQQNWSIWTRERDLPASLYTIRLMWEDGEISTSFYRAALRTWRQVYGVSDEQFFEWYSDTGGDIDD